MAKHQRLCLPVENAHYYSWQQRSRETTLLNALLGYCTEFGAAFAAEDKLVNKRNY